MRKLLFNLKTCNLRRRYFCFIVQFFVLFPSGIALAQSNDQLTLVGQPVELTITPVSEFTLRVSLIPVASDSESVPVSDGRVLVKDDFGKPIIKIRELTSERNETHSGLRIKISPSPLSIEIKTSEGKIVQNLTFDQETGGVTFKMDDHVYGLGRSE